MREFKEEADRILRLFIELESPDENGSINDFPALRKWIETALQEAYEKGLEDERKRCWDIADRRALRWMDSVHIESPWNHLTVRKQIEFVRDEIALKRPAGEGK